MKEASTKKNYWITLKTAGSFISFHIPSTPLDVKSLTKLAHQERTFDCVKSGKTQGPGHTSPIIGLEYFNTSTVKIKY